jgi:hypothetical protein
LPPLAVFVADVDICARPNMYTLTHHFLGAFAGAFGAQGAQ